jgi:hypothetical protein
MMKIKAWVLIIASYIFTFFTPIIAAFLLLADDTYKKESKGGFLFLLVLTVSLIAFAIYLLKIINAQKANHFKTLFKAAVYMTIMWVFLSVLDYITFNIDHLSTVVYISMGGYSVGALLKTIAIQRYKIYIRELGVF